MTISLYSYFLFGRLWSAFPRLYQNKNKASTLNVPFFLFCAIALMHAKIFIDEISSYGKVYAGPKVLPSLSLLSLSSVVNECKKYHLSIKKKENIFSWRHFLCLCQERGGRESLNKFFVCPVLSLTYGECITFV